MYPFFSILTPSYNQGHFIEKTILSVLEQQHASFEHIVIDGGSNDSTVNILKAYSHLNWLSENDQGQTDALNKGLLMATGEVIGWINSDDYYLAGALAAVEKVFADPNIMWLVGKLVIVNEHNSETRKVSFQTITYDSLLQNPDCVTQPSAFYRRSFLRELGPLDTRLKMVMDYELWLRCAKRSQPFMLNNELAAFRLHQDQKTTRKNIFVQMREITAIQKREGLSRSKIKQTQRAKRWSLVKQVLKQWLPKP
jgi:glycosyltransferase involved in cell wall biosynthesis